MKPLSACLAALVIASGSAVVLAQDSTNPNASPQTQSEKSGCPEAGSVPQDQLSEKCRSEAATDAPITSGTTSGETTGSIDSAPGSDENNSGSEQNKQ